MIHLFRKDVALFDLLDELAGHVGCAADRLGQMASNFPGAGGRAEVPLIRDEGRRAAEVTGRLYERVNRSFVPPFAAEDVHALAEGLGDVIGAVRSVAERLDVYRVAVVEPLFVRQAEVLAQAAACVVEAVRRLSRSRGLSELGPAVGEMRRLEGVGDDTYRAALSGLFDGSQTPLHVMKWQDLHGRLEGAINGCERVGKTLQRIVLKNA